MSKKNASNGSNRSKRIVSVSAMNDGQKEALRTISQNQVTILTGSPGTGKTHLPVAWGLQELMNGRFKQLILTRPVVEAGESLGYLPGGADEKIAPYMMPMTTILSEYLSQEDLKKMIDEKVILILPIAYMRGVTFKDACVVADECQNTTLKQIHLLLTRIGKKSKIIISGDVDQTDLDFRKEKYNGLRDAVKRLSHVDGIGHVNLGYDSCVRESIVNRIDEAYRDHYDDYIENPESIGRVRKSDFEDYDEEPASFDRLLEGGDLDDLMDEDQYEED